MSFTEFTPTDGALLTRLAQRHEPSLDVIMQRYWKSLYVKAYNFLRDEDSAKDCVQEVFIALWENKEPQAIINLSSYLHQAARFQALMSIRKSKRLDELAKRSALLTELVLHPDSLDTLYLKELKTKLEAIISEFPKQQQQIFRMSREAGLSYREIAEQLGISVKTVEKKMSLSLAALRGHFEAPLLALLFLPFL